MEHRQKDVSNKYPFMVTIIGIVLMSVSLVVLIGLAYNIPIIISILSPNFSPKVNSSICFLLSGFALLFVCHKHSNFFIYIAITIILFISSTTIFQYMSGINLGIDQFFIKTSHLDSSKLFPGRMAPITALNFIFVAFAFLYQLQKDASGWIIQFFALLIFITSLLSFYNHIFDANLIFSIVTYTIMSISTTALFMLLSVGI